MCEHTSHIISMWLHVYTAAMTRWAPLNTQAANDTRQHTYQHHCKQIAIYLTSRDRTSKQPERCVYYTHRHTFSLSLMTITEINYKEGCLYTSFICTGFHVKNRTVDFSGGDCMYQNTLLEVTIAFSGFMLLNWGGCNNGQLLLVLFYWIHCTLVSLKANIVLCVVS